MVSSIYSLPVELCLMIASDEQLSRADLCSLRAACRVFTAPLSTILFRRIKISRLRKDRDALESIARSPHLACHVRELVWYEMSMGDLFDQSALAPDDSYKEIRDNFPDDFDNMARLVTAAMTDPDVFWIPHSKSQTYLDASPDSKTWFLKTMEKFPLLSTFLSCPMPGYRTFEFGGYTIHLDMFKVYSPRCNEGFFNYLLPGLDHSTLNIRALRWADEGKPRLTLSEQMRKTGNPLILAALTTIDLCFSGPHEPGDSTHDASLVSCLANAQALENLTLCFERVSDLREPHTLVGQIAARCFWPKLTSLEIVCVSLERCNVASLFGSCVPNLRRLVLRDCNVTFRDIQKMRNTVSFAALESITVTETNRSRLFSESTLLNFLKHASDKCIDDDGISGHEDPRGRLLTVESVYDHKCWPNAAYFDSMVYPDLYDEADLVAMEVDFADDVMSESDYSDDGELGEQMRPKRNVWEFFHRNGEVAQGEDSCPWEYFSDWDSEAGDVAMLVPKRAFTPPPTSHSPQHQNHETSEGEGASNNLRSIISLPYPITQTQ